MKAVYAVLATLLAAYLITNGVSGHVVRGFNEPHGDCEVDWIAANAWADGWDPYSPEGLKRANLDNLGHPPTTPFWYLPFRKLDLAQTHVATGVTVLILLAVMLFVIGGELGAPALPATAALVFGFVVDQVWLEYHLAMMQVGIPTAFLIVMAWFFLRRQRELEGGVMLGLACTFKFFPGILMLFLLLTKRFKAFAAGCLAWLAIAIVMTSRFGIASWGEYFAKQPAVNDYWAASVKNGGLAGIVLRLWWPACKLHGGNLPAATALTLVVSLVLLVLAWRVTRGVRQNAARSASRAERGEEAAARPCRAACPVFDGSFALWSTLAVFLNPVIWEHYYVLLIFPWAVALSMLVAAGRSGMAAWKAAAGTAVLSFIVGLLSLDMELKAHQNMRLEGWHFRLHVFEVANWLPWPLLLGMIGTLLYRRQRQPS